MSASRVIMALLGLGLIVFFWPFESEQSEQVVTPVEPPPAPGKRLFTKRLTTPEDAKMPDAARTETSKLTGKEQGADQTAALKTPDEVAVKPARKPKLFYQEVVQDGGTIKANGTLITLAGIEARAADATYKDEKRAGPGPAACGPARR